MKRFLLLACCVALLGACAPKKATVGSSYNDVMSELYRKDIAPEETRVGGYLQVSAYLKSEDDIIYYCIKEDQVVSVGYTDCADQLGVEPGEAEPEPEPEAVPEMKAEVKEQHVPPEPPPVPKVRRWIVTPTEGYKDAGYVRVTYKSHKALLDKEIKKLDEKGAPPKRYDTARETIPKGGVILVEIGRPNIEAANTKYYTFIGRHDTIELFRIEGKRDVPMRPGKSGLWRNVAPLPIREHIGEKLDFYVVDRLREKRYKFEIRLD